MKNLLTTLMILAIMLAAGSALAGAKVAINDNATLDIGYRVQTQMIMGKYGNMDGSADGSWDSMREWKLRRGRLRLGASVGEHLSAFLQTDVSGGGKSVELIDAFVNFKVNNWLQFITGRNMAPASRQNLTSSGALMAIDRPGMAYKSLTWGGRSLYAFSNATFTPGGSWSGGPQAVRDMGITVFGSGKLGEQGNLKYYAGMYNGIQPNTAATAATNDKDRMTFRAQYNLWDAEGGYYNSSTYLGKKKTLGIGFSYDMQDEVAGDIADAATVVDYKYWEADGFFEYPMGDNGNALTVEAAYMNLDLGDMLLNQQGKGFYGQIGYYISTDKTGWQPWFAFESWSSDNTENADGTVTGDYTNMRFGVTYYLEGQAANIKAGYEMFKSDAPLSTTPDEDSYNTFVLGFYTTY